MGKRSKPGYPIPKMKINWNAKYPSQQQPIEPREYYLTDRNCVKQRICPNCNSQLMSRSYNIPVYNLEGDFCAYRVLDLLYCSRCQKAYMTDSVLYDLEAKLANAHQHVAPSNVQVTKRPHSDSYLYLPMTGSEVYFEQPTMRQKSKRQINTLSQTSFLSDEGYNINLDNDRRRLILIEAVSKYGKRRVVDHLKFLIDTRMGQANGPSKYTKAIAIWRSDLNYILDM